MKIVFEVLITLLIIIAALLILIRNIKKDASGRICGHDCSSCPYYSKSKCSKKDKKT